MVVKGFLLILLFVLLVLLLIGGVVLIVFGFANDKPRMKLSGIIGSSLALVFLLLTAVYGFGKLTKRINNQIKKAGHELKETIEEAGSDEFNYHDEQTQFLKDHEPDTARVADDFYTEFGFRDWWRMPLIYPYSIETVEVLDYGNLHCLWGYREKYETIGAVTHLALDANYLLLRTSNKSWFDKEDDEHITWRIFYLWTQEVEDFPSEEEMQQRAADLGFQNDSQLLSLEEYYGLFY